MGECQQEKHNQHAPSMKMECDYLNDWNKKIKRKVTYAKISPKMMKPKDIAGEQEEEEERKKEHFLD